MFCAVPWRLGFRIKGGCWRHDCEPCHNFRLRAGRAIYSHMSACERDILGLYYLCVKPLELATYICMYKFVHVYDMKQTDCTKSGSTQTKNERIGEPK